MGWREYEVKHSQTLQSLANYLGTTAQELKEANCLAGNRVSAGAVVWAPDPAGAGSASPPTPETNRDAQQPVQTATDESIPASTRVPSSQGFVVAPETDG